MNVEFQGGSDLIIGCVGDGNFDRENSKFCWSARDGAVEVVSCGGTCLLTVADLEFRGETGNRGSKCIRDIRVSRSDRGLIRFPE